MNLLKETKSCIKDSGHSINDIVFIGSEGSGYSCTWDEFTSLANHDYDKGFGASKVATDLIIVFSDGVKMWRGEYDGSEWWEYSTPFFMPSEIKKIERLFANSVGWESLADIHERSDD